MPSLTLTRRPLYFRLAVILWWLILSQSNQQAEQLPIKTYLTADGLAHDHIENIVRDSRGFLWFCTADGLSRFDGSSFTTYGTKDGLPSAFVNNVLETRSGIYWIATNGGLARFDPRAGGGSQPTDGAQREAGPNASSEGKTAARTLFTAYKVSDDPVANRVDTVYEDRTGQLWVDTDAGLFRMVTEGGKISFQPFELRANADNIEPAS